MPPLYVHQVQRCVPILENQVVDGSIAIKVEDLKLPKEVPVRQGVDGPVIGRCINLRVEKGRIVGDMQMFVEPLKEWKVSTFVDVLRHAESRRIDSSPSKDIEFTARKALDKLNGADGQGVDFVFFSDGTAVASEGAHTRNIGTEYTPEEETEPAKWWIYV